MFRGRALTFLHGFLKKQNTFWEEESEISDFGENTAV
jgi:hypothetical protein